jgi:HD-GYP domain-containing protein (c-di-GMP phosphodiesterase class II)
MSRDDHVAYDTRFGDILAMVRRNNPSISRLGFIYAREAREDCSGIGLAEIIRGRHPGEVTCDGEKGALSRGAFPVFRHGDLSGVVWFDAALPRYFTPRVLRDLEPYTALVEAEARNRLDGSRRIRSLVGLARTLARHRDDDTGAHLNRMGLYAREIAAALAPRYGLSDSFVEHVHLFSPLHDIGKIAISDQILLKPGRYTPEEFDVMKNHPVFGQDMVEEIGRQLSDSSGEEISLLRQIVRHHHENVDGTGYPDRLHRDEIPLAARIVAVADVFDAISSPRPYKPAWSMDSVIDFLVENAGRKFDTGVVGAFLSRLDAVKAIQAQYAEA